MFKILMVSKITIVLTTFVNNTNNVHVNDLTYYFFEKAIYMAYGKPCFGVARNAS